MIKKSLAALVCVSAFAGPAFCAKSKPKPLTYPQIVAECLTRGNLYAAIVQARNFGIPKAEISERIEDQINLPETGPANVQMLYPIAHAWTSNLIRVAYEQPMDSSNMNPIALSDEFGHECMDNPDKFTVPSLIDWKTMDGRNAKISPSNDGSAIYANLVAKTASAETIYSEYMTDALAADAKYEGTRIVISGKINQPPSFSNAGIARIRMLTLSSGPNKYDMITLCFNESCKSYRRATISDVEFRSLKQGDVITASCIPEPVMWDGSPSHPRLVMVWLAKCELATPPVKH